MSRYPARRYIIDSDQFKRTRGELGIDDMSEAEFEFHENSLTDDESDDYIQEGVFGKELANFVERHLRGLGYNIVDNYAEDWGRVVSLICDGNRTLEIGCLNYADGTETEDGSEHMISVVGRPTLKARLFTDQHLLDFLNKTNADIEQLISSTPHVTLLEMEED